VEIRRFLRSNSFLLMLLILVDVLLLYVWRRNTHKAENLYDAEVINADHRGPDLTFSYGERLPDLGVLMKQREPSSKPRVHLLLFFDPSNPSQRDVVLFGDVLAKEYREQIEFFAIATGRIDWLEHVGFRLNHLHLIADEDFSIRRHFKMSPEGTATIVVDPNQEIRFAFYGFLNNFLLRQLVQRFS
jgi:hypothetical protein